MRVKNNGSKEAGELSGGWEGARGRIWVRAARAGVATVLAALALLALAPVAARAQGRDGQGPTRPMESFGLGSSGCPKGADPVYCQLAKATGGAVVACDLTTPEGSAACSKALMSASRQSQEREARSFRRDDPSLPIKVALALWGLASLAGLAAWAWSVGRSPGGALARDMAVGIWAGVGCSLLWALGHWLGRAMESPGWTGLMLAPALAAAAASRALSSSTGRSPAAKAALLALAAASPALLWVLVALSFIH